MSPIVKKKREKFSINTSYLLFFFSVLCVASILISFTTGILDKPLSMVAGDILTPFQKGITAAGTWCVKRVDELGQIKVLIEENEQLKARVDELSVENTLLQQEKYELNNLRELFLLSEKYTDFETTGARIIAKDSSNWFDSFVIDKGTVDGVTVDMNVIAGGGLVGRVVYADEAWSKVTTIINDNSNVSGMVLSTADNLIVSGSLELIEEGIIPFSQLVDSAGQVKEGDKIVTSNISDKFLPGILIGYISRLDRDPNNLTKSGTLVPAVDFEHLEEVLIVLRKKPSVEKTGE